MKTLKTILTEGKCTPLFSEVQNEIEKNAEYHSFTYYDGKKIFNKGFLTFNEEGEFFGIVAFNTSKEFAEMMNADEDTYKEYDSVKVGEYFEFKEQDGATAKIIRIW